MTMIPVSRAPIDYYAILDRVPKGRDEGTAFQPWLRRHDEHEGA